MEEKKSQYEKGELLVAGPRKKVWSIKGMDAAAGGSVIIEYPEDELISSANVSVAANIFKFLRQCGISSSYNGRFSKNAFLAYRRDQVPLRIVVRRRAHGSYLSRHGGLKEGEVLSELSVEFFLETKDGKFGETTLSIKNPLVADHLSVAGKWKLLRPDKPLGSKDGDCASIDPSEVCASLGALEIDNLARHCFLVLERAFSKLGAALADLELRFDTLGQVSRAIDFDSMRLVVGEVVLGKGLEKASPERARDSRLLISLFCRQLGFDEQTLIAICDKEGDSLRLPRIGGLKIENLFLDYHKGPEILAKVKSAISAVEGRGVVLYRFSTNPSAADLLSRGLDCPVIVIADDLSAALSMPAAVFCVSSEKAIEVALRFLAEGNPAVHAHLKMKEGKL
jgi:hypothetical protein